MNQYDEAPARKPNTRLSVTDYHFNSLRILDDLYATKRENLIKHNYNPANARVLKQELKDALMINLRCSWHLADEIIASLFKCSAVVDGGSNKYVERKV